MSPQLKFKLFHREQNAIMRKIYEAFLINSIKPQINDKDECIIIYSKAIFGQS